MAFNMDRSASATVPSSTAIPPLYSILIPSFLTLPKAKEFSALYTFATIIISLLVLEQAVYRYKKRHLPGAAWTIPLIGKFADSVTPTMEAYKRQWDAGALSAVSVFNMYVQYAIILLRDSYPSPVLLSWPLLMNTHERSSTPLPMLNPASSTQPKLFFCPKIGMLYCIYTRPFDTDLARVFLTGKEHVEYRRGLNALFTRKALG